MANQREDSSSYAASHKQPIAARITRIADDEMSSKLLHQRRLFELMIIVLALGITALLFRMQGYKLVILNLYFLPVTLAGFFLGRYRAGVVAVLCVLGASLVTVMSLSDAAATPLVTAFAVAVWAGVLGLTALLTGTLSDDRTSQLEELHDAYVGVVEVLSQYLQAHPRLKARSIRVAELSHNVAARLKFSPREIDDIRVAALLYDVGNIEITSRVIRRAIDSLESDTCKNEPQTIQGMDLMLSLASVLNGAVPLLLNQQDASAGQENSMAGDAPLGARIISAVRDYDSLTEGANKGHRMDPLAAIHELRTNRIPAYDPAVLAALERLVSQHDLATTTAAAVQSNGHEASQAIAN